MAHKRGELMKKVDARRFFSRFYHLLAIAALLCAVIMLHRCATIPHKEFETYRSNFASAKSAAQDVILTAKIAAEMVAKSSDNPDGPNVRQEKLTDRITALDARLQALELISEYNEVLVDLASGTDPDAVVGNLTTLSNGLNSFGVLGLTKLVEEASPLFGVVSQTVAVIDDLIKKKKFKEAANAAQVPIIAIIEILKEDANSIHEIQAELMFLKQDEEYNAIVSLKKRFNNLANAYLPSDDLDKLIGSFNTVITELKADEAIITALNITHTPATGGEVVHATTADLETMKNLVDQIEVRISAYNNYEDQVLAHQTLINEYKNVLTATANSFISLNTAVLSNQRAATMAFLSNALALRKAIIEYQEVKKK
jgi:hypothetical protein